MADRIVYNRSKGIKHVVDSDEVSADQVRIEIVPDRDDTDVIEDMIFMYSIRDTLGNGQILEEEMYAVFHYDDSHTSFVSGDVGYLVLTGKGTGGYSFSLNHVVDVIIMKDSD